MESVVEEEQPERRAVLEQLLEIAKTLWDPTLTRDNSDITRDTPEQRQLRKRIQDTEFKTGVQLSNDPPETTKARKKHYKSWTSGSQVPLDAEIELLEDHQLGRCLTHHQFVLAYPQDWFPSEWMVKSSGHVMA